MTFRICAADPGIGGAIAFADVDPETGSVTGVAIHDMPVGDLGGARPEVDEVRLHEIVSRHAPAIAVIEKLSSRGGMAGSSAQFSKGKSYASLRSALRIWFASAGRAGSVHPVAPDAWKRAIGVGSDKEAARQAAISRFPGAAPMLARKRDHDRAEALLLIAYYVDELMLPGVPVEVI